VNTRIVFDPEFLHAIHIRGLTIGALAKLARLSPATVSAAIHGNPVNVRSAVLLARAVAACPVVTSRTVVGIEAFSTDLTG
jgi:hypothetical protein